MPIANEWVPESWAAQLAIERVKQDIDELNKPVEQQVVEEPTWQMPEVGRLQEEWQPTRVETAWQPVVSTRERVTPVTPGIVKPTIPSIPTIGTEKKEEKYQALWEQPAKAASGMMGTVGKALSKVPGVSWLIKQKPVQWTLEKLREAEQYFAAIVTTPWSPSLPHEKGESWLSHQKREYENWDAPTYVKGLTEAVFPVYWLPYAGWLGKGAIALRTESKLASVALRGAAQAANFGMPVKVTTKAGTKFKVSVKGISEVEKAVTRGTSGEALLSRWSVFSDETLNAGFSQSLYRRFAQTSEKVPGLKQIVGFVGGKNIFVRGNAITPEHFAAREVAKSGIILSQAESAKGLITPVLGRHGNVRKVLKLGDDGIVGVAKPSAEGAKPYFLDVLDNPAKFGIEDIKAKQIFADANQLKKEINFLRDSEGLDPIDWTHAVKGWRDEAGKLTESTTGSLSSMPRHYATQAEGVLHNVVYNDNIYDSLGSLLDKAYRDIAKKRLETNIGEWGKTAETMWAEIFPKEAAQLLELETRRAGYEYALESVTRVLSHKGTSIPGAVIAKIRNEVPEIGFQLDEALLLRPEHAKKILTGLASELRKEIDISPRDLTWTISKINYIAQTWRKKAGITMEDITDALDYIKISQAKKADALEKAYVMAHGFNKEKLMKAFREIQDGAESVIKMTVDEQAPLKAGRDLWLKPYRKGAKFYEREKLAKFSMHPVFGDKLFPAGMVTVTEKFLQDEGVKWLSQVSTVSAISRMLTATMDLSAGFIQGISLLALRPHDWIKAQGRALEFLAKPGNLNKYRANPKNYASAIERHQAGGSVAYFEFTEGMRPLMEAAGKVPVVGKLLQKGIQQTYGRAEAAFVGFGEVARDKFWQAHTTRFRDAATGKLAVDMTVQRELARSIDLMTGNISSQALGIGATQRQFEGAFLFFSPRYTRAGMALISDIMRGGYSGAQARVAVGAMLSGGLAFYQGVCKATGQEMNLDPRSGKFMTIRVGNQHLGVGGIQAAMLRFAYDVAHTAATEPVSLASLDRFDNPFIRFMYGRTAPFTGLAVGMAIEQKDYLGQPFESTADWAKFMLDKITPIAIQQAIPIMEQEGAFAPVPLAAQFGGLRMFPKSAWELREDARERYAQQMFGEEYAALPRLQQLQIDEIPEIQKLKAEADEQTVVRGEALSVDFIRRQEERDRARETYIYTLSNWQRAVELGLMTTYEFKDEMQNASYGLGMVYEHIDEKYPEVVKRLEGTKGVNKKYIGDVAYSELVEAMYSDKFEDRYGIFDYDAYNKFRDSLKAKYGASVYNYILQREAEGRKELPPLAQEYYKAKEVLRPYWQVYDWAVQNYGRVWADSSRGQSFIQKVRKQMRLTDPNVAKYYRMFYEQT